MERKASRIITLGGPVGLAVGVLLGFLAQSGVAPWLGEALVVVRPVGDLWMNALRVSVVPLTVCLLVVGVCSLPKRQGIQRLGGLTFGWILALLLAGAIVAIAVTTPYLAANPPAPIPVVGDAATAGTPADGDWSEAILPSNLFAAAASGDILPLAVLSVLFGLALRAQPLQRRQPVEAVFVGVRDAVMTYVRWVMYAVPVGAGALMFSATVESGLGVAGTMLHFVVYVSVLLSFLAISLGVAVLLLHGKRALAALAPLVAVAVGTRSSLASMPTLVESAEELGLDETSSEIVLPACVSVFKMNRTVSSTAKLLFLAAATGVVVGPHALVVFVGTVVLLSFATPGIPAGGGSMTWGAYVAAGVPLEAVVLFEAVDAPTDFAKTALNVIADFSVAVFVSRAVTRTQSETSPTPSIDGGEPAG